MKTFELTLVISANKDLSEEDMFERFEAMNNKTPKGIYQEVFKGDCALITLRVQEIKEASISYVKSVPVPRQSQ